MSILEQNTIKLVEGFNDQIKEDLASKGIDNTGTAASSLRIEVDNRNGMLSIKSLGIFYFIWLDKGRAPGKFPPPDVIEEWTASKPVDINPYLVGRKIAREGTEIYKDKSKGVQLDEKRNELLRKLKELAPKWAKQDVLIKIRSSIQKFNNI